MIAAQQIIESRHVAGWLAPDLLGAGFGDAAGQDSNDGAYDVVGDFVAHGHRGNIGLAIPELQTHGVPTTSLGERNECVDLAVDLGNRRHGGKRSRRPDGRPPSQSAG